MGRSTGFRAPAIPEICLPGEGMHLLSSCSGRALSGLSALVRRTAGFASVRPCFLGLMSRLWSGPALPPASSLRPLPLGRLMDRDGRGNPGTSRRRPQPLRARGGAASDDPPVIALSAGRSPWVPRASVPKGALAARNHGRGPASYNAAVVRCRHGRTRSDKNVLQVSDEASRPSHVSAWSAATGPCASASKLQGRAG